MQIAVVSQVMTGLGITGDLGGSLEKGSDQHEELVHASGSDIDGSRVLFGGVRGERHDWRLIHEPDGGNREEDGVDGENDDVLR